MQKGTRLALLCGAVPFVTLVPASILVLYASTLVSKNVYVPVFDPGASNRRVMALSRAMVLVITALGLLFAVLLPNALVDLLLIGYDGVSQLFPAVVLGLCWPRLGARAAGAGIVTGLAVVVTLVFGGHDPFLGMNAGFVALVANFAVTVAAGLATRREVPT